MSRAVLFCQGEGEGGSSGKGKGRQADEGICSASSLKSSMSVPSVHRWRNNYNIQELYLYLCGW